MQPIQRALGEKARNRVRPALDQLLDDPGSPWWAGDRDALLRTAAAEAHTELVELQGEDPAGWSWGELHALTLTHGSFGESGIAPIES